MSDTHTVRPHLDTVATMHEVADHMARGDSMAAKLRQCAERLAHTECATSAVPNHAGIRERILRDWAWILDGESGDPAPTRERLADVAAGTVPAAVVQLAGQQGRVAQAARALFAHEFDDPAIEFVGGPDARLVELAAQARRGHAVIHDGDAIADLVDAIREAGNVPMMDGIPTTLDEVADWNTGNDLSVNLDNRADTLAELALSALGAGDPAAAQVFATLALDQRTASAAAAWPGIADSLNGTLDELGESLAEMSLHVCGVAEEVADLARPWSRLARRIRTRRDLRRRPADG